MRNLKGLIKLADQGLNYSVPTLEQINASRKWKSEAERQAFELEQKWLKEDQKENMRRIWHGTLAGLKKGFVNAGAYVPIATNPWLAWKMYHADNKTREEYFKDFNEAKKFIDQDYIETKRPYHNPKLETGINQAAVNTTASAAASIPTAVLGGQFGKALEAYAASAKSIPWLAKAYQYASKLKNTNKATRLIGSLLTSGMKRSRVAPAHMLLAPLYSDALRDSVVGHGDPHVKSLYNDDGTYNPYFWEGQGGYTPFAFKNPQTGEIDSREGLPIRGLQNEFFGLPARLAYRWYDFMNGRDPGSSDYSPITSSASDYDKGLMDRGRLNGIFASRNAWAPLDMWDQFQDDKLNHPSMKYIDMPMALLSDVGSLLPGRAGKWGRVLGGLGEVAWPLLFKHRAERKINDSKLKEELKEERQREALGSYYDMAHSNNLNVPDIPTTFNDLSLHWY